MKKTLPILVMVVLSNYAYANCVNTSEEQITTKTLLSTHYKTTQSEGTILVDNSQTDAEQRYQDSASEKQQRTLLFRREKDVVSAQLSAQQSSLNQHSSRGN